MRTTASSFNIATSCFAACFFLVLAINARAQSADPSKPNIVIIYTDDLGYGDISAYGATKIKTPNIDRIAEQGLKFTNAHTTSSTCTPSRFSFLTGRYAWRKTGTGIAPGDAALIIPTNITTLPAMLQKAGYKTAAVGKWHLGLGPAGGPNWNGEITPGPLEIGFNYCFLMPATGDRVPCVYMENHRVVDLDPSDPIMVSYKSKVGKEPTGAENPELLKMMYSQDHDNTIVNGVSRIGWMTGGKKARWIDEDMADVFTNRATKFIEDQKQGPFFLYFATHQIHVPRLPNSRFLGKSGLGPRGDAILELDWSVGEVLKTLDRLNLTQNTMVIFSSDNGPVLDDGYKDKAVEMLNGHTPAGPLRGGKYSAFDAGTRVPFIISWPARIKKGKVSNSLVSQVDLYASLSALTNQTPSKGDAPDSFNMLNTFLGKSGKSRSFVIEQSLNNTLSILQGKWKYIEPSNGPKTVKNKGIELGNDPAGHLYKLSRDIKEQNNLVTKEKEKAAELAAVLKQVRSSGTTE